MHLVWSMTWGDPDRAGDGARGAVAGAQGAALALGGVDGVVEQVLTHPGGAALVHHVGHILVPEILQGGEHRVGGRLAQGAQGGVLQVVAQLLDGVQVLQGAVAIGDLGEQVVEPLGADAAGRALAAALVHAELQEELGDVHHAVVLVHDDEAAGAHHGADGGEGLVVDGGVDETGGDAAAGGAAGLGGLELLAVRAAAADVLDDGAQGGAHGGLHQAGVGDLAAQGKDLGALALLGADGGVLVRAVVEDPGDIGVGLHVVEQGGPLEQALIGGEGRAGPGLAPVALDGGHEGGLLAADEGAGAQAQLDVEVEAGAEDVLAQQAVFTGLADGDLQPVDGDGVLGPDVDVALVGADGVAGDGHGLQHAVGVALQHRAVHEGAGVALVGVAGHVLDPVGGGGVVGELPLQAGGEAGAAPAPQAGGLDVVDDLLGRDLLGQDAAQGGVAVHADVLVDVLGVDDAAVAQGDAQLVLVESGVGQGGGGAALVALHVEQPLDDAALDDVLRNDLPHVVGGDLGVAGPLGVDHDDGAHGAQAEAAGLDHLGLLVHLLELQLLLKGLDDLQAVGGGAAGAGTHQNVGTDQIHLSSPPYSAAPMVYSVTTWWFTR